MVWFQVNHVLPLVCSACGWKERGQRPPQWRAWPVIRRSGGCAAAAGRTSLAASTACFDCLVLCSAFQGTQLQGWVPDSLPYPITKPATTAWAGGGGLLEQPQSPSGRSPERERSLARVAEQGHSRTGSQGD